MKTGFVLAGLLVAAAAAAQAHTAPRAAVVAPRGAQTAMSPSAHVGDTVASDPQFDLLRKQITALKRQQSQQQDQIARLQTCVRQLVKASKSGPGHLAQFLNGSPGILGGPSSPGTSINSSPGTLKATAAGKPRGVDLSSCD